MTQERPVVIVTRKLPRHVETRMCELFDTRLNLEDTPMGKEDLQTAMREADILVPTVTDRIDENLIKNAGEKLKMIANFGAGIDHIDISAANRHHIIVSNTPGVLTEDTADLTMALILNISRRIIEGTRLIDEWAGWSPTWMLGHSITGKRLGIIGMGRIGQAVAKRAKAFGMQIHYHNRHKLSPHIEHPLEATYWESLDQMLTRMDVISVNCPRTPATFHLLSARRLKLIRNHAYIVNTSRGDVIDEACLAQCLEEGAIAGAGLDVYENEPAIDSRLLQSDRVVLVPHMGSATIESRIAMGEKVIINMQHFIDHHTPPDKVLPEDV